jgi:hypothetical protein
VFVHFFSLIYLLLVVEGKSVDNNHVIFVMETEQICYTAGCQEKTALTVSSFDRHSYCHECQLKQQETLREMAKERPPLGKKARGYFVSPMTGNVYPFGKSLYYTGNDNGSIITDMMVGQYGIIAGARVGEARFTDSRMLHYQSGRCTQ